MAKLINTNPVDIHSFENDKRFSEKAKFTCKNPRCGRKADLTYDKLDEKVWKMVNENNRHTICCGSKRWSVRDSEGRLLYSY